MSHPENTLLPSGRIDLGTSNLALGPLDGRYAPVTAPLTNYLSEAALNRDRIHVEVEWFIYLCEHKVLPGLSPLSEEQKKGLRAIVTDFNAESVAELAEIEAVTVHDVKAVEYYIGRRLKGLGLDHLVPLVHFGCTSEDINNLSYALGIKDAVQNVWIPAAEELIEVLLNLAEEGREVPMLSRTHGQPATPTFLNAGKKQRGELVSCFLLRIEDNMESIGRAINSALQLSKRGGGVAFALTNLRESGAPIKNIENS